MRSGFQQAPENIDFAIDTHKFVNIVFPINNRYSNKSASFRKFYLRPDCPEV